MTYRIGRFALVLSLWLCVGATHAKDVDPAKLTAATEAGALRLEQPFAYAYTSYGALIRYVLSPGVYRAEFSDRNGVYYRGPRNAVEMILTYDNAFEKGHVEHRPPLEGGVYVGKSGAALIYHYVQAAKAPPSDRSAPGGGLVADAVNGYLASRDGKITFARKMRADTDLAGKLKPEPAGAEPAR